MRRWISTGTALAVTAAAVVAAPAAASGTQQWSPGQRISSTETNSINADTELSADGSTAVAVWQATDAGGANRIVAATAAVAGGLATWSAPTVISGSSTNAIRPNLAVSADGARAVVVWGLRASNATMSAAVSIADGVASWGTPATVDPATGAYSSDYADVAISGDGSTAMVAITKATSSTAHIGVYAVVSALSGNALSWGTPQQVATSGDTYKDDGGTSAAVALSGNGGSALAVFATTANDLLTSASAIISGTTPTFGSQHVLNPTTANFRDVTGVYADLSEDGTTALAGAYRVKAFAGSGMLLNTAAVSGTTQSWGTTTYTVNAKNLEVDLSADGSTVLALYDQTTVVSGRAVDQASAQTATVSGGAVSGGWHASTLMNPLTEVQSPLPAHGMLSADGSTALATVGYSPITGPSYSFATTATISGGVASWSPTTQLQPLPPVQPSDPNGFASSAASLSADGSTGLVVGIVAPADVSSSANEFVQAFTLGTAPTIGTVTPNTGSSHGGTAVTIAGTGFGPGATVTIGGVPATDVTVSGSGSITAVTGAHAAGTVDVIVTNLNGQSATSTGGFTYTAEAAPEVDAVTPDSGLTVGGTEVTIVGSGFATASGMPTVTIGGVPATAVDVVNPTRITARTPAHTAGSQDVVVTNPDGRSGTGTGLFSYVQAPPPVLTGMSPASGPVSGGFTVTITGSGFFPGAQVMFGSNPAAGVSLVNSQLITAVAPAGSPGLSEVRVVNPDGSYGFAPTVFVYDAALPPAPVVQTAGACAKLPKKLNRNGTTVLLRKHCRTNAGTLVKTKITANKPKRGHYSIDRSGNGKVRIRSFGKKLTVTVELRAKAVPGYTAYQQVKRYKVR